MQMIAEKQSSFVIFALSVATSIATCGCGKGISSVPVSGRVTLVGKPLSDVAVNFSPVTGGESNAFASFGKTDSDGRFKLRLAENNQPGATAGQNRVTLHESSGAPESDGAAPMTPLKLPPKARDGTITFEVPPAGTDAANFEF